MLFEQIRLKVSRSESRSSSKSSPDPFSTLQKQGSRLKPVSPKMKFPSYGLPPKPKAGQKGKKLVQNDENEVETPRFSSGNSKNSSSSQHLNRRRTSSSQKVFNFN